MRNYEEELATLIKRVIMSSKKVTGYEAIIRINFPIDNIMEHIESLRAESKILGDKFISFSHMGITFTVIESDCMDAFVLEKAEKSETIEGFDIVKRELTEEEKQRPITLDRIQGRNL